MIDVGQNKAPRGHTKLLQSALTPAAIARVAQSPNTYRLPVFTFRRNNRQRAISAHRFALLLVHPDLGADAADIGEHYCNEPLCVRVDSAHVRIGTQTNNLTYAVGLGRHRGSRPTTAIDRAARSIMLRTYLRDGGDPDHAHRLFQPVPSAAADQLGLF